MAKKTPLRQCIGCGQPMEKKNMIRVIRNPEGGIELDSTGKKNGRGAYLCLSQECLAKAEKSKGLERSFKMSVPKEIYQQLSEELSKLETR
ncbi:MAG: YlxR family protein [Bacteroides sp.]|nr:YlxR family protein [Bacteroides sp.]MCM1549301.1 YlxR family protein [Clostridium sp.]